MIKGLEVGKYYKLIEREDIFVDKRDNKKYSDLDLRKKLEKEVLIDCNYLYANMEAMLKSNEIFSNIDEANEISNKTYDEIITYLKRKKEETINKFDSLISKWEKISIAHKELDNWVNSLQKDNEIVDVICFKVNEINILLKENADNEIWEENLSSDELYRENGLLTEAIDSTDYSFICLEQHENKIKNIESNSTSFFIELTDEEIIKFDKTLKNENEYYMSLETIN